MVLSPNDTNLTVTLLTETIVHPSDTTITKPYNFPLSNLDRQANGLPVHLFYAYRKPNSGDITSILAAVITSLSEALNVFSPFAGQVSHDDNGEPRLLCNNHGVRLIHASVNVMLSSLDFYHQNQSIQKIWLPVDLSMFPLSVQVSSYTCGGFSISWMFDHVVADASGFVKFLTAWSDIAQTKKNSSNVFKHDRVILCPRSPLNYDDKLISQAYTVCSIDDEMLDFPTEYCATERRLYSVKCSTLERLRQQALSTEDGRKTTTRMEALSAYLWKLMAKAFDNKKFNYTKCRMGWAVDGRSRIGGDSLSNYTGNVAVVAGGEERIEDLKERSLAYVSGIVSQVIGKVTGDFFLDLIDWMESQRPRKALPDIFLGESMPGLMVSACHNLPFMASMDFGFGLPSVGMFCLWMADKSSTGCVHIVSTVNGDSWLVSAFIWPDLAKELESDPNHVFEPVTREHLGL